jgi:hypothetical protein
MKCDTIFYKIFAQSPARLFELLTVLAPEQLYFYQPANPTDYTFSSIEVKEFNFRIDGVFLPLISDGWIFFVEIQMQPDEDLVPAKPCSANNRSTTSPLCSIDRADNTAPAAIENMGINHGGLNIFMAQ